MVGKLNFIVFLNNPSCEEIRNKFVSVLQGLTIAKIRQQGVIAETETAFHPITLSFKRILVTLFHYFDLTFATLEKKTIPTSVNDNTTIVNKDSSILGVEEILLKYPSFIEIQQAVDNFVANVDAIQNKLGVNKNEYASNLWKVWEQSWSRIHNAAVAEFEAFKKNNKSICKTEQEYLAAIEKRIKEIENA